MSEYIIVKNGGEGLYEEKKSRFISTVFGIEDEAQAAAYIETVRRKYWDARHNCYAFVLGDNNETARFSDDGEPSGTAGKPVLEVIARLGIRNCLITVTRYFGGTLLGTGGLMRAYTNSALDGIANSGLAVLQPGISYIVKTDYTGEGRIRYLAASLGAEIKDAIYTDKVEMKLHVTADKSKELKDKITEITGGRALIVKDCDLPVEIPYKIQ